MHVTILGARGNIESSAPGYSRHSGVLVDDLILLDLGEKEYLQLRPKYIFITHLHPDHAALEHGDKPDAVIYAPESSPRLPMIHTLSRSVRAGPYTVTPVPTVHSERVKSAGYLVVRGATRLFYSSDLVEIQPRFHRLLKNLDVVITDGSFIRPGGMIRRDAASGRPFGHNGIPDLVRFFSRFTSRIVVTHFGSWFFRDPASSRRKIESLGDGVTVVAAYDGMRLRIGSDR